MSVHGEMEQLVLGLANCSRALTNGEHAIADHGIRDVATKLKSLVSDVKRLEKAAGK